jgi:uncharacterized repeat protein (TIGR03847 family)
MADDIDLPSVDAITLGTVGEPGQRVFYLQVWDGGRVRSLKLEKQQVAAFAVAVGDLLSDLPPAEPLQPPDLLDPGQPDWIVGTMALTAFDDDEQRAMLILSELVPDDVDADEDAVSTARLGLSLAQLASLAALAEELVEAGRPPCPLCGRPLDPAGHTCPKTNGSATRS